MHGHVLYGSEHPRTNGRDSKLRMQYTGLQATFWYAFFELSVERPSEKPWVHPG